jgi:hypothetical protein
MVVSSWSRDSNKQNHKQDDPAIPVPHRHDGSDAFFGDQRLVDRGTISQYPRTGSD